MKSIVEQINDILQEIHSYKDNLDIVRCSELLVTLSVLKASLDSELADAEIEYNRIKNDLLTTFSEKPYNKIDVQAKATDEYKKLRKLQAVSGSCLEIGRSIKRLQNAIRDTQAMSGNM